MYLISLGASEFKPSVFNICRIKNAPSFLCSNEIVSPQCFIPRKQNRMSNLSRAYYSKIIRKSCFYYRRLYILFVTAK